MNIKHPLSIKSKRLLLTPMVPDERIARTMVGWLNDNEITKYSEQRHIKHTVRSQMSYMRRASRYLWGLSTTCLWGIWRMDGVCIIGSITATFDAPNDIANIGILIGDKENMGRGYGYEAWEALCDHLPVRKIEAGCMAINRPMMSICSKYGMMEEGRQEDHFIVGDTTCDLVHWGKLK
jgi:RimJ/RimL family protein N-acetyltransferase